MPVFLRNVRFSMKQGESGSSRRTAVAFSGLVVIAHLTITGNGFTIT